MKILFSSAETSESILHVNSTYVKSVHDPDHIRVVKGKPFSTYY